MPTPTDVSVQSAGAITIHTLPQVGQSTAQFSLPVVQASDVSVPSKIDQTSPGATNGVSIVASSSSMVGVSYVANSTSATNLVAKASPGNLYDADLQSSINGFLMIFDATSVPSDGVVSPVHVIPVASGQIAGTDFHNLPEVYLVGICMCVSTTGGFTKTTPGSGTFLFRARIK
jgi:hypothetical protein